ncbi:RHS repeat-associated core domain-containing protein, partial [Empedobacter brevis]|uniref:RHS repeat-associated core domain-containing protein n=1 Tax=Empedobacter brevis TaxID=247 RepID=UPI0028D80579
AFGEGGYPLTVNYYDDYPTAQQGVSLTGNVLGQTVATGNRLKGMPTLSVARSLGTWENNQWNFEHNYTLYDNKYLRAVKNHKINYLGGSTIVESELDFRGKATKVVTTHKRLENNFPVKTTEVFSYDKFERLLRHTHQINTGKVEVLTQNSYNNIGQLTSKKVGNTTASPYQTVDYQYNIRGWLTQINDITNLGTDLFAFKINYNTKDQTKASNATQELFNGNIAQTLWTSQENPYIRSYDYNYDGLNRLTNAGYSNLSKDFAGTYDEQLSYDHNGNILTLKRYGQTEQATPRLMDNLTYNYENAEKSNRLLKVTDSSNTLGFNDGNKTGNDYTYDVNGNLKTDLNKGIEIDYNHLNLPTLVKKGTQTIEYAYSATGVKLRKIVKAQQGVNAGLTTTTTEYLDGFQYKDGVLQFFPTTEGYVNAITAGSVAYNYVYNLTDHLGNVRVSYAWDDVNSKLKTVNEDHYYPFGLQHKGYNKPPADITIRDTERIEIGVGIGSNSGSTNYKYKYNGKELQEELGLNIYDYGARNYDPALGRWFNIDPLAEKYASLTPYNYTINNPINYIDPDGREVRISYNAETGELSIMDMDNYKKGLKTVNVSAKDYNVKGIRDKKGKLIANQVLVIKGVFSGGIADENGNINQGDENGTNHPNTGGLQVPIPNGEYDILDNKGGKHDDWYRLDPQDSFRYDDTHQNSKKRMELIEVILDYI